MAKVLLLIQLMSALVVLPLLSPEGIVLLPAGLLFLALVLVVTAGGVMAVYGPAQTGRAWVDAWSPRPPSARVAPSAAAWSLAARLFPPAGLLAGLALTSALLTQTRLSSAALFGLTWGLFGVLLSRLLARVVERLGAPRPVFVDLDDRFARRYALTPREAEAARAVLDGLTYRDAAERLLVSPATVKSHLLSVYQKTGAGNKIELLRLVEAETERFHQRADGR